MLDIFYKSVTEYRFQKAVRLKEHLKSIFLK